MFSIKKATKTYTLAVLLSFVWSAGNAEQYIKKTEYDTVSITDFGVVPNSRVNVVAAVQEALAVCKKKDNPLLIFPEGRYDFWPQHTIEKVYYESNTTDNNPKKNAIFIHDFDRLTIDGQGATFIYHSRVQPFTIDNSSNVTIRNLSVDWEIPLTGQAEVMNVSEDYIDIKINTRQHPYVIENHKLYFVGEGWKSKWGRVMEYEKEARIITPQTGDVPSALGKNWRNYKAEELEYGLVRLHNNFQRKPERGNKLILRHTARDHALMFIVHSKNVEINNFTGHHCAGLGILSQYSENLTFRKVSIVPNTDKGRYFSGHDDGLHFSGCKGQILVDSCRFEGLMDDPINIHGTYVKIIEKISPNTLRCRFMQSMSVGMVWARAGEEIAFINNKSLATIGKGIVKEYRAISTTDFEITMEDDVPEEVVINYGLENLTWTPSAVIRNSYFGGNRARGILVTTPKKVVIENNVFKSSGSAILIAGDVNSWFESGATNDILIKENTFLSPTNTSLYQFTEAIISIYPEIPVLNDKTPVYHENIRIVNNEFYIFDYPVLFAQSVGGLKFEGNQLIRSYDFEPFHPRKYSFSFLACDNVSIKNNMIDEALLGKNIMYRYMPRDEIEVDQEQLTFESADIPDHFTQP